MRLIDENVKDFFRRIVLNTMKEREEKGIVRPDMIQLLQEAKKGTLAHEAQHKNEDAGFATVEESHVGKRTVKRSNYISIYLKNIL
jgi:cytochrome P450 family 9